MAIARQNTIKYGIDNMRGNVLKNVGDPVGDRDSANKQYVDDSIATAIAGLPTGPYPYIHLGMTINQTVGNGSTVAFDVVRNSNDMTRNGNGINVKAGKTYRLQAFISIMEATGGGYIQFRFYDNTVGIGEVWYGQSIPALTGWKLENQGFMYYTPSQDSIIYIKTDDHNIGTGKLAGAYNTSFIAEEVTGMKGDKGDTGDVSVSDIVFEGWTAPTFQNGWVNFGTDANGTYEYAGYCKDALGFVHLRGLIKNGTPNSVAFTLPVGYRPEYNTYHVIQVTNTVGSCIVKPDGTVQVNGTPTSYAGLSGITFKAA